MLKRTYFMAVIDGVFYLDARVIYSRETLSVVTFEWSESMGSHNTLDITVIDRRTKQVVKYNKR